MNKYFTAIVIFYTGPNSRRGAKYHNIKSDRMERFETFARNAGAHHINYYGTKNREFFKRVYLQKLVSEIS
jgi:hypothetical protein